MTLPPFDEVVSVHGETVLRVCRAVLGPQEAEDAWSETFLAALAAYPRLRPGSNVRGWLVTIAHHKAIDRVRAAAKAGTPVETLPERADGPGEPEVADPALWRALAALPAKQRLAVAYHHVGDLPYAEVAELLGSSEAAARRSAADGIATLRNKLTREAGDGTHD